MAKKREILIPAFDVHSEAAIPFIDALATNFHFKPEAVAKHVGVDDDSLRCMYAQEVVRSYARVASLEEQVERMHWVSVEERLPDSIFNVIVWIPNDTPLKGYWDLASYGEWFCEDEDCHEGHPDYVADNDEGNRRGFGWHRQEETHGGPYDYVTVDLNHRVTHWMPLPEPPSIPPSTQKDTQ